MKTTGWVIAGACVGLVIAIALGVFGQSETVAESQMCNSLASLQSSVNELTSATPSTASQESLQSSASAIQDDWGDVKAAANKVVNVDTDKLQAAWDNYVSALRAIPPDMSLADTRQAINQQTQVLSSAVHTTVGDLDCSSS